MDIYNVYVYVFMYVYVCMYINIYTAGAQPDGGEGRGGRSRASKGPTLHHALIVISVKI